MACTGVETGASSTGAGVAFGSIGGGLVATAGGRAVFFFADAVASELSSVGSALATGLCASGEATGSASTVGVCCSVPLRVAVDPGGHVIQHSAPAGNGRSVKPATGMSAVSRRKLAFMIHPPFVSFISARFLSVLEKRKTPQDSLLTLVPPRASILAPLFGRMGAQKAQI